MAPPAARAEDVTEQVRTVYGALRNPVEEAFNRRSILAPTTADVDAVNDDAAAMLPGHVHRLCTRQRRCSMLPAVAAAVAERHHLTCLRALQGTVYLSANSVDKTDAQHMYPTEFLNNMCPSGVAPHRLDIKAGMPLILLRNLDPAGGFANGMRLLAKVMHRNIWTARSAPAGTRAAGSSSRASSCSPWDSTVPFQLHRRQFPVRAAFVMTINKVQGQTLEFAGVYLPNLKFPHGHLHVAASRVGDPIASASWSRAVSRWRRLQTAHAERGVRGGGAHQINLRPHSAFRLDQDLILLSEFSESHCCRARWERMGCTAQASQ